MRLPQRLFKAILRKGISVVLASSLLLPLKVVAQSASFIDFEEVRLEAQGEEFNTFFSIAQDQEGYLWFGTNNGLVRYDGYESKVYRNDANDSTSIGGNRLLDLGDNPILLVYVDSRGDLWAATTNDLSRYERHCDCFVHYHLPVANGRINAITEDQDHNLWVGGQGEGLFKYDRESDQFIPYLNDPEDPNSITNDFVNELLTDQYNNIWIGLWNKDDTTGGLVRYNPATGTAQRFQKEPNNLNSLTDNRISSLLEDQDGQIWVGTLQNGLHQYNTKTEKFTRTLPNPSQIDYLQPPSPIVKNEARSWAVNILHQNQNGNFWVGSVDMGLNPNDPIKAQTVEATIYHITGNGLNHFDSAKGRLSNYDLSKTRKVPTTIFEDRQGQLWLGYQRSGGLYKMDNYARKFKVYPQLKGIQRSAESTLNPGVFWISTLNDGLHRLDSKSGAITTFLHDEEDEKSIGHNSVRATFEDQDGIVWVGLGTGGNVGGEDGKGGLDRLDPKTGIFKHYPVRGDDISNFSLTIYSIAKDADGFLWIETGTETLLRFDKNKETFKEYSFPTATKGSKVWLFGENTVNFFGAIDYSNGVSYQYDVEKDTFLLFLEGYQVNALAEDEKGGYWIANMGQGLVHYNPQDGSKEIFTTKDGLINDLVVGIIKGKSGIYWLSTRVGLSEFDSKTKEFTSNGLPQDHFHVMNIKARDGQFLFGGNNNLYAFYPEEVNGNPFSPNTIISGLQINGEFYNLEEAKSKKIKLTYDQNDLSFEYIGIHNSKPSKNKYQYKLIPYDKNWIDAVHQRTARYTNLDPGAYTFQVKSANSDGVWSTEDVSLSFFIARPWWQTYWAYGIYLFLIGLFGYLLYRFLFNRQLALQETRRLKELDNVKTKLYTNISHEFRTPLTVISGMADKIVDSPRKWGMEGGNMIKRNSAYLLLLVNQILDLSKLESGALKIQYIQSDIISYLQYLMQSFHSLAENKDIRLHFYAEEKEMIMDFDPDKIQHIFTNLLSNAIKYTPEGGDVYVYVKVEGRRAKGEGGKHDDGYLFLKIRDTGVGIPEDQLPHIFDRFYQVDDTSTRKGEGTGIGLALTKELVQLLNGDISVKSEVDQGTEFTVQLPIANEAPLQTRPQHQPDAITSGVTAAGQHISTPTTLNFESNPLALIIEDNADVAKYLFSCLEDHYQLIWAKNGQQGIDKAFEVVPDIIISDVMMPEKDGFEVCQTLKQDIRTSHIPIILLTAKADIVSKLEGLRHGADAYLAKPFNPQELDIRLQKLIEIRKQIHARYQQNPSNYIKTDNLEDEFLSRLSQIIHDNISDENFGIQQLCRAIGMSRTQLHRKIKALTDKSTSIYIRSIRLAKAQELLKTSKLNISEIAYAVGFSNPVYFTQVFSEEFGVPPSEMRG